MLEKVIVSQVLFALCKTEVMSVPAELFYNKLPDIGAHSQSSKLGVCYEF